MKPFPWYQKYPPGVPYTVSPPLIPLQEILSKTANQFGDIPYIIYNDEQITFRQVDEWTTRIAYGLQRAGIHTGDRIGIFMPNIPAFVMAYYGILKAGGVVVAINPLYTARELIHQIRDSDCKILFTIAGLKEKLLAIQEEIALQHIIICPTENVGASVFTVEKRSQEFIILLDEFLEQNDTQRELPEIRTDDPAIFQYTGGTTGVPKGAVGLHRNVVTNIYQFRAWLYPLQDGKERILAAIPLYHVYGMVLAMGLATLLGAGMVLITNPRDISKMLSDIEKHQPVFFPGVPTLYHLLNQYEGISKYNLSSLKYCISGAAALPVEVKRKFEALTGATIYEGYGLSEAPTATHCNPIGGDNREGSIGLPLPGVECKIIPVDDSIPEGNVENQGELLIRSPQVMRGYHNQPEETAQALRDGWLHTGDIVRMDSDGYFYVLDRKKDLIKVSGNQVWPREVEEVLRMLPDVLDAGVAGIPDTYQGEAVKAWLVLKPHSILQVEEIDSHCRKYLAHFKVPKEIEFREQLPRTAIGKLLRRELIRQHLECT